MAIYHLSIKIVKRGQGKSAVAAAAYRAGEKLVNDYDGMVHDYTRKGGVVHSEILLPPQASEEFADRSTLWNSVEQVEKHRRAQLAREIEIALPVELDRAAQIKLVQDYVQHTFVDAGMCADFAIHDPKGDVANPHAHILLTMRPLDENSEWGDKQRKEYLLDADGNKIYDPKKRQYKCDTVPATDWNEQTKAEEWRAAWAAFANSALERSGVAESIDHRSYARQGVEQIPTVHLGVAASQMEKRGIATDKGNLNRMIRQDNRLIRQLKQKISDLENWLREAVAGLRKTPQPQTLTALLAGNTTTKQAAQAIAFLEAERIDTWEQLEAHLIEIRAKTFDLTDAVKQSERRMKDLKNLLDAAETYLETRPVHKEYRATQNAGQREKFYSAHTPALIRYDAAVKKLDSLVPDKKLHVKQWQGEFARLAAVRDTNYTKLKTVRQELKLVEAVRRQVEQVRRKPNQQHNREETR